MYDDELKNTKIKKEKEKKKRPNISLPTFRFNVNFNSALKKFGILAICVFAFIFISTKMNQSSENKVFEKNFETLKTSAYKYFKENEKPEEINEEFNITLQDLIDEDFIKPLTDKKGNVCDSDNTTVTLTKKTKTKYDLVAHLDCNQKEEDKSFSLTYSNTNSSSSSSKNENDKTIYYKLQKEVTTDNYQYSCPDGYTLNGKYCYGKSSTLTATPVAKYKTTSAKTTKATYKKPQDEYEYVEYIEMPTEVSYKCSDSKATLVGDKCIITKEASMKEDATYECMEGTLEGDKCVISTNATKVDYKYTCPSGKLFNNTQCKLTRDYSSSYSCPSDYPNRDGDRCYYSERAERDWGEWHFSSRKTYTREMEDTETKKYELVDSYEGASGRTRYVYKVYTRAKEYVCYENNGEEVELKGSRCYYYTDGYEDKRCPSGYDLSDDETECVKLINATKKKTTVTYTCSEGYKKSGSGSKTTCEKYTDAKKVVTTKPVCTSGYTSKENSDGTYSCVKELNATKIDSTIEYVCPTGYEKKGTGKNTKCYKKTTTEGYYYCKNSEATLENDQCVVEAKTELIGYKCPSGYDLNGDKCVKVLAGDKVKATKTNDPDINITYKWSDKKSEAGWTFTGETKEM